LKCMNITPQKVRPKKKKKQAETSLWVVHLTQPVYTESLFYLTQGHMLPLLHCMCGWLAQWAKYANKKYQLVVVR
jgi:hypothetical protein